MKQTINKSSPSTLSRTSLVTETAQIIRLGISEGRWSGFLPGERDLGQQFQISRPTVRSALKTLDKEGLIEIRHGHHTKIVKSNSLKAPEPIRKIAALTSLPGGDKHSPRLAYFMGEIARYVAAAGLDFVAISDKRTGSQKPQKTLAALVAQNPNCCWILFRSNAPTQKWFSDKKIPALLLGTCFSKGILDSIDQNMRATCRHAAGRLLGLGHQHLGLFLPKGKLAGDITSIEGVQEAIALHRGSAQLSMIEHDRTFEGKKRAIQAMLRMKRRPTGMIVCGPNSILTSVPTILGAGVKIPQDLSIICRDSENYLEFLGIDITRYKINDQSLAQKLSQLAVDLAAGSKSKPYARSVEPNFHLGESIGPAKQE